MTKTHCMNYISSQELIKIEFLKKERAMEPTIAEIHTVGLLPQISISHCSFSFGSCLALFPP